MKKDLYQQHIETIFGVKKIKEFSNEEVENSFNVLLQILPNEGKLYKYRSFEKGKLGVYAYDSQKDEYFSYYNKHLPVSFHGTGDIFASALCGALTKFNDIKKALEIAVDYTVECIKVTLDNPNHVNYGVEFEKALPLLIERLK